MSSIPDRPFETGWGGRLADIINPMNDNPQISMSITLSGTNRFQIGRTVAQYAVGASAAVGAFYNATVELGVANQVTTFTASDFGRSYVPNAGGTDHGWGNHQFIIGGAVNGGEIFGRLPSQTIGGPDDAGRGRWIPSTSVDEYNATLATWFGVSQGNLATVLPNIGRFANPNLGFMA